MTDDKMYICPCCGERTLHGQGDYEICPVCGWEDDPFQSEHPDRSGANRESLNEAKQNYRKKLENKDHE